MKHLTKHYGFTYGIVLIRLNLIILLYYLGLMKLMSVNFTKITYNIF